jgi:hypothetical protein
MGASLRRHESETRQLHSAVLLGVLREVWTCRSRFIVDQCLPAIAAAHLANRRARVALLSTRKIRRSDVSFSPASIAHLSISVDVSGVSRRWVNV